MEVSSALVKNAKPVPETKVGRPALNDASSSLDTSFSPKRPKKSPDLRQVIPVLDTTNMNTGLFIGNIGQDAFCAKEKRGWAVQNVKEVFDKRQELFHKFS